MWFVMLINYFRNVRLLNRLTPNDLYMGRTAPLTTKRCILYIYSTNIGTEYLKHALYSPFFSLQNAICFIMLTCLVPLLFTFYIQDVLKLKKNNSGTRGLKRYGLRCLRWLIFLSLLIRRLKPPDDRVFCSLCPQPHSHWVKFWLVFPYILALNSRKGTKWELPLIS
jgi:hypothetical protein